MTWDFWRFSAALLVFGLWMGVWLFVKFIHVLEDFRDDFWDVFADAEDEAERCPEEHRLVGAYDQPGHLHTCSRDAGHDRPHHCPVCNRDWTAYTPRLLDQGRVGDRDGGAPS